MHIISAKFTIRATEQDQIITNRMIRKQDQLITNKERSSH